MPQQPRDPLDLLNSADLDLTKPFTTAQARAGGLSFDQRAQLIRAGLLVRPIRGCFYAAHLHEDLALRLACLRLVVPAHCVVTDRTAGWLHGAPMALAPGDHVATPKVSVFHQPGNRLRNTLSSSGERSLAAHDVIELDGVRVTSPLRTACDLGRLLHRDSAFAALDSMLRLDKFTQDELIAEVVRFNGFRGVRKLRTFAPLADGGSESFGESVLRLRWYDGVAPGLPEVQINVFDRVGLFVARVDLGVREWKYAAEYDGADFHGPDQADHDRQRRTRLRDLGWIVDVFRRADVFGAHQNADLRLKRALTLAKLRVSAGSTC